MNYRANFLWPHEKESIEEAGYEFANGKSEGYTQDWWNTLLERVRVESKQERDALEEQLQQAQAALYNSESAGYIHRLLTAIESHKKVRKGLLEQLDQSRQRDALVRWQNRAIDRLIMWLEGKDEIDFIVHAHRLLQELCNCEYELPPCSICYRIGEATRKEIESKDE